MKSLVIGGAGFVGAYLIRHLVQELGHETAVTKMPHESITTAGVTVYDLDILSKEAVTAVLKEVRPDYVFHLAAQSSVSISWKNPALTVDVNIKGAVNLLEALRGLDWPVRVLLIGSGEEYGYSKPEEIPIQEDNQIRPGNIYAAAKACQNMLGKIYADAYGLEVVMVRAFNHIGPNQAPLYVTADFCRQAAEIEAGLREAVIRVGNLKVRRDFTDVRDVVRAYAMLIEKGMPGETYNVGSGHAVKIADILDMVLAKASAAIKIEVDQGKLRPADVPVIEADISKLQTVTGWKPQIGLEQTIQDTLDFWRKNIDK